MSCLGASAMADGRSTKPLELPFLRVWPSIQLLPPLLSSLPASRAQAPTKRPEGAEEAGASDAPDDESLVAAERAAAVR